MAEPRPAPGAVLATGEEETALVVLGAGVGAYQHLDRHEVGGHYQRLTVGGAANQLMADRRSHVVVFDVGDRAWYTSKP